MTNAAPWNALLAISVAGMIVAAWFGFAAPKPKPVFALSPLKAAKEAESQTQSIVAKAADTHQEILDRTWDTTPEALGSQVLGDLTRLAEVNHLKLAGFRVGKPIQAAGLQEAPFLATLDGSFMDLMALVNTLEKPESKLALGQLAIETGANSDHVTANLNLTGFLYREATK